MAPDPVVPDDKKLNAKRLFLTANAIQVFAKDSDKWSIWLERLENAFLIFNIEDDADKATLLLHYMGTESYNAFRNKTLPDDVKTKTYKNITDAMKEIYEPKTLEVVENFKFHSRKQLETESVMQYSLALKKMAENCNFGNFLQTALRNQFVFGLRNTKMQQRMLEVEELTFDKAVQTAAAMELSSKGGDELQEKVKKFEVHAIDRKNNSKKSNNNDKVKFNSKNTCYRCGSSDHLANNCKHADKTCSLCGKVGHLRRVCLGAKATTSNFKDKNFDKKVSNNYHTMKNIEEICVIDNVDNSKFFVDIECEGNFLTFEVDSGSPISLISFNIYKSLFGDKKLSKFLWL